MQEHGPALPPTRHRRPLRPAFQSWTSLILAAMMLVAMVIIGRYLQRH